MAFHCPNCNGSMVFDVATQSMLCQHCGATCDPQDYVVRDQGISTCANCGASLRKSDGSFARFCPSCGKECNVADGLGEHQGLARFTCQNCGAELEGTEDSLIGFCPYCGGQAMVRGQSSANEVESIVPFQVEKERCVQLYGDYTKKVACLPKEFKDPSFIQNFVGIYMPYYQYDVRLGDAHVTGSKTVESNSRYDKINYYSIDATVDAVYDHGVSFDASKYLDDELSERTQPFDHSFQRPFSPSYLAGFYADASTVAPQVYDADAAEQARVDVIGVVADSVRADNGISVDRASGKVDTQTLGHHIVLHPLWFLTWRKEDRVAYAVINGESGKVVSDLPLDLRAFAIRCVITSVVIFLVLELLFQPTPLITSLMSLLASLFMANGIRTSAQQEYEHVSHANDKGWTEQEGSSQAPESSSSTSTTEHKKKSTNGGKGSKIVRSLGIVAITLIGSIGLLALTPHLIQRSDNVLDMFKPIPPMLAIFFAVRTTAKVVKWHKHTKDRSSLVSAIVLLVTVLLNTAIVYKSPVNDGWYYLGDALCIAGLVGAAVAMMITYNRGTTRPVPKLFDRTEVQS